MRTTPTSLPPPSRREGQVRSAFTVILETLLGSTTGAVAAVLADEEGEAVDHAGVLPAYDVKLAAAHWQIVLRHGSERRHLHDLRELVVEAERGGYVVRKLFGGYVLVMVCRPGVVFSVSSRALEQVERELTEEAGFPASPDQVARWTRVRVLLDPASSPAGIWRPDRALEAVQVIEPATALADFAQRYRVRTDRGEALTLIRERSGRWYAADGSPTER